MLHIQGDYLEGGGSIVRLAVALSCITKKPIKITNIRSSRSEPGLKTQHLRAIESVSKLCNGYLKGNYLGSKEIEFSPSNIEKHNLKVNIETAGSIGLLLQCLMLPCFYAKHRVKVEIQGGGTQGLHAPNLLYIKHVLFPLIKKLGFTCDLEIEKYGFHPKGGASVIFTSKPVTETSSLVLESQGKLISIQGISLSSKDLLEKKFLNVLLMKLKKYYLLVIHVL